MRGTHSALVAMLVVLSHAAAAQELPLKVTLEEAVQRAEANSLRLRELQARLETAEAIEAKAAAADRPLVAALAGYMRTNHLDEFVIPQPGGGLRVLYPDVPDNYRARLDLQWPIYTAGRAEALERAAAGERQAAAFDLEAARADARLEGARAFWALVTAAQTEDVLSRALASTDAHVADLRSRLEQGLIPPNEVLTAEAQRSRQRVLALEAGNLREVAEADLRRAMGEDARQRIEPVAVLDRSQTGDGQDVRALLEAARQGRAERRSLASRIEAARQRHAAAEASGKPQVSLAGGYDYARPNPRIFPRVDEWRDSWDASVNVSWTLWDGGRREAEEAEAAAGARVLEARAAEFDRQLTFEVDARRLEVDSARAAIEAAVEGVAAAREARRVLGERFAAGVATSTDVLDADTAVLQAELDRTRAIANLRLAVARLQRALGR